MSDHSDLWGDDTDAVGDVEQPDAQAMDALDVPEMLESKSGRGVAAWKRVVPMLRQQGFVKERDREPVTRYCYLVGQFWDAAADIDENGLTYWANASQQHDEKSVEKLLKRNPASAVQQRLLPELRQLEDRLGISPMAAANILSRRGAGGGVGGGLFGKSGEDDDGEQPEASSPSAYH